MDTSDVVDRDQLMQLLGAQEERIHRLELQLERQQQAWEPAFREWQRLIRDRRDLAEWLIDQATNETGQVIQPVIDAALCGDPFVPCSFRWSSSGHEYHLKLSSTEYFVEATKSVGGGE